MYCLSVSRKGHPASVSLGPLGTGQISYPPAVRYGACQDRRGDDVRLRCRAAPADLRRLDAGNFGVRGGVCERTGKRCAALRADPSALSCRSDRGHQHWRPIGSSPCKFALDLRRDAALLAARVDLELVIGRGVVAAIAGIGDAAIEDVADERLHLRNDLKIPSLLLTIACDAWDNHSAILLS